MFPCPLKFSRGSNAVENSLLVHKLGVNNIPRTCAFFFDFFKNEVARPNPNTVFFLDSKLLEVRKINEVKFLFPQS